MHMHPVSCVHISWVFAVRHFSCIFYAFSFVQFCTILFRYSFLLSLMGILIPKFQTLSVLCRIVDRVWEGVRVWSYINDCRCVYVCLCVLSGYRRLCDDEDDLSEVTAESVPSQVRDWLAVTFTRSMSGWPLQCQWSVELHKVFHQLTFNDQLTFTRSKSVWPLLGQWSVDLKKVFH